MTLKVVTIRVPCGDATCPACGLAPCSRFNQHDGTFALWCSNDHRWTVEGYEKVVGRINARLKRGDVHA